MAERDRPPSLEDLESRLRRARAEGEKRGPGGGADAAPNGIGFAFRIGVELVAALMVGLGIGWALDRWLGTGPWLLVLFFFLGAGAGILNVYRTASAIGAAPGRNGDEGSKGA